MIIEDITEAIGGTPLLKLPAKLTQLKNIDLYGKLEFLNPFGSVKDRIAWGILGPELGEITSKGQGIIENSSGNTAKAMAVLALRAGVPFKLVSAMVKVKETKEILKLLGVELEEISGVRDCYNPNDPNDPHYVIAREVAKSEGKLFFPAQFTNPANPKTHQQTTAKEIIADLGQVDYVCSGLGTAGSTLGLAEGLKRANPALKLIGIVAGSNDYIPGIRTIDQLMEAGLFEAEKYHEIVTVESSQALDGVMALLRGCGVMAGPSSGAHLEGALSYLRKIDNTLTKRATAVTIICDRIEWYLSYVRERRPELFGDKRKPFSIYSLTPNQIAESAIVPFNSAEKWSADNNALVIDIRAPMAFEMGSFPGAINIPSDQLEKLLDSRVPFVGEERKVLFVCPVGEQSRRFAAQLSRLGGEGFSLEGGLMAWRSGQC